MKKFLTLMIITLGIALSAEAFALDLSQARARGLVGEKLDGYIGVVTPSAEAQALVADVNTRRRAEYEKISAQNKQPVSIVGKVAAETIINDLPPGSLYQGGDGTWKKK